MTLIFISLDREPNYTALSTDIINGRIVGASIKGATVFLTNTQVWKIVDENLDIIDYKNAPIELTINEIEGQGVAGVPAGGVMSIQGVLGGNAIPISGNLGVVSSSVSPSATASTDSLSLVAGSTLDTLNYDSVSYTVTNSHISNSITYTVFGANSADFSDKVITNIGTAIAAGLTSAFSGTAVFRYYAVYIISTVVLTPGTALVRGIAKG